MRRAIGLGVVACMLAVLAPAALAEGLDIRLGAFAPRADSNLFDDDEELYTVGKDDWRGFTGGAEYSFRVKRNLELGVHVDGYERSIDTEYRDYERPSGRPIQQTLKLSVVPIGVSLRIVPTRRWARVAPYLAVGADLIVWKYEEFGDFVDFESARLPVIEDSFVSDGVTGGWHVAAGVRVRVGTDISIVGEARYLGASLVDMGDDFRGNRLDVSGASVTLGLHLRF